MTFISISTDLIFLGRSN